MKRPNDIPNIADFLCWLAWLASILAAMAGAADSFGFTGPRKRERDEVAL